MARRIYKRDSILRRIKQRQKGCLMPDGESVWQATGEVDDSDSAAASATFTIVTRQAEANRHGNKVLILPDERGKGIIADNFFLNPIVLLEHGLNANFPFPIGVARPSKDAAADLSLKKSKATSTVWWDQGSALAMDVGRMVEDRVLAMSSIGFRPMKASALGRKKSKLAEGVEDLTKFYGNMDFVEIDLWEWSVVALGADPGALKQTYSARKVGGEKLCQTALEWLRSLGADEREAQGIGIELPDNRIGRLAAEHGVSIAGDRAGEFLDSVEVAFGAAQAVSEVEASDVDEPTPEPESETSVDRPVEKLSIPSNFGEQLAERFDEQASIPVTQLADQIDSVVREAVKPVIEQQQSFQEKLNRKLGQVA